MKPTIDHIIFEVTGTCNQSCKFCYNYWKRPGELDKSMNSYKKAYKTLKRLYKQVKPESIVFTGGEPLLAERFNELVLFAKIKRSYVTIISNGTAVIFEEYKTLQKLKVGHFQIPLLSHNAETHDKITGVTGSWEKALSLMKSLLDSGVFLVTPIIITKDNVGDVGKTISLAAKLGIKNIMLNRYSIGGNGLNFQSSIIPDKADLQKAFHEANEIAAKGEISITSNVCTPYCILNPELYKHIAFVECSNNHKDKPITVDIEGNVRICNHSPVVMGNIYETNFNEIIETDYIKSWARTIPEFCSKCNVFPKCQGGCRGASEQLGLSITHEDPLIRYYREGVLGLD